MELLNATEMEAGYTLGLEHSGRERLVVAVKGTFTIPARGGVAELAEKQEPLVLADTFTGEPGLSATVYESDFAMFKPSCDVLLIGSAYAPDGRPATRVTVAMRVGQLSKSFDVVGDRHWTAGLTGITPSHAKPFTSLPISYDRAFGGGEPDPKNPELRNSYAPNPVGVGYFPRSPDKEILGQRVPNTEVAVEPVKSPRRTYAPMAFGPLGRNFAPRIAYGGTYDEYWLEHTFPFPPPDLDPRYHQGAPPNQQLPYPSGGETVQLLNLTPRPLPSFRLPPAELPVELGPVRGSRVEQPAVLDTIILEPDRERLQIVWRTSFPLRRNIQEVAQIVVGRMPRGWYRARSHGKPWFPSLAALAAPERDEP